MYKLNKIISLSLFILIFIVYALCVSKTITFWDSPEFITSSYNLQATHPPGAPFYTILCNVILHFFTATQAAYISSLISAFFGALTVTFLFKITYYITIKIQRSTSNLKNKYLPFFTGITSALTLAFSNSFWTSSTEAEVYTLSFALMTILIYIILKWENTSNKIKEKKYLLLFSFLLGIASGVHLIILSLIIPLSLLYTYKRYSLSLKNIILSLIIGCGLFFCVYLIAVQGLIKTSAFIDTWLVNTFGFSVNIGVLITIALLLIFFSFTLWYSYRKQNIILHHALLISIFFLIGFCSYIMPIQRANANTLVANKVKTSNQMLKYLTGEQFGIGKIPLLKGYSFNAPLDINTPFVDTPPTLAYNIDKKKYTTVDNGKYSKAKYDERFSMYFPRVFAPKDKDIYKLWTSIKGEPINYNTNGQTKIIHKPTYKENFIFFINYQVNWLNLRYLFWNFIGKQNNNHGIGYIKDGNWISGINSFDNSRVGNYIDMPNRFKNDKSRNAYYFIPFILGIFGFFALIRHKQYLFTTLFLFLTFGLGITLYVNPIPSSILIRERDYIFIGSFVIFSLWVGLSIISIFKILQFITPNKTKIAIIVVFVFIGAPLQLIAKGWDDHQRHYDTFSYDLGKAYLDACPKQSILITNGDNMTFPLWYLQDIENYRTDVRVLNFDLMSLDSNIDNLKRKIKTSNPIKINLEKRFYFSKKDRLIPLQKEFDEAVILSDLFEKFQDSTTRINWNGKLKHYIPSTKFSIPIDYHKLKINNLKAKAFNASNTTKIEWNFPKKFYGLNEIVLLNIISNNIHDRPVCFAINGKTTHYLGLQNYFIQNGLVEQLAPIQRLDSLKNPKIVNTKMTYPYIMNTLQFKGLNDDNKFIPYENRAYTQNILRRSYYFLAQALLEEGETEKAIAVLDKSFSLFPNKTIAYKQYAFALGKLYFRAKQFEKGSRICVLAIDNIWEELQWTTSFNPPNSIINIKYAEQLKSMYLQMVNQFPGEINITKFNQQRYKNFESKYKNWIKVNWPY